MPPVSVGVVIPSVSVGVDVSPPSSPSPPHPASPTVPSAPTAARNRRLFATPARFRLSSFVITYRN
jgi:hypothetical protein